MSLDRAESRRDGLMAELIRLTSGTSCRSCNYHSFLGAALDILLDSLVYRPVMSRKLGDFYLSFADGFSGVNQSSTPEYQAIEIELLFIIVLGHAGSEVVIFLDRHLILPVILTARRFLPFAQLRLTHSALCSVLLIDELSNAINYHRLSSPCGKFIP